MSPVKGAYIKGLRERVTGVTGVTGDFMKAARGIIEIWGNLGILKNTFPESVCLCGTRVLLGIIEYFEYFECIERYVYIIGYYVKDPL